MHTHPASASAPGSPSPPPAHFNRSLRLIDGVLLVVGSMIGSGIFITSADMARSLGSSGWLLVAWALAGVMTIVAAISYGELSGMFPKAGGQYVYLQKAFNKKVAFLYGWSFFAVIQTGTIAAVAVAFAKFTGYLFPVFSEERILLRLGDFFSVSASQLLAVVSIMLLTFLNTQGVRNGKWIQFFFTFAKVAALLGLIILGFWISRSMELWQLNFENPWNARRIVASEGVIRHFSLNGTALIAALGVAMVGALFSSEAWNGVTFIAGEIKRPQRNIGWSLFLGTLTVIILYLACNIMYLSVLSVSEIALAPADRVAAAAAEVLFGTSGAKVIAVMILVSTFGCNNGLILAGARVYFQMARDKLFFQSAARLNRSGVPARSLWLQCIWASLLCLSGAYSDLLNFIVFTVLLFYILTIAGIFILRKKQPDLPRPYKAFGYPILPALYILLASCICIILLLEQTFYAGMGLVIVLIGLPVYAYFKRKDKPSNTAE